MAQNFLILRDLRAVVPILALLLVSALPQPARAAFHLNEITKILVGFNGDSTVQAVELKMLTSGENFVSGAAIKTYDVSGALIATLGTFGSSVPNGIAGRRILCATPNFAVTFGITPDLFINPGLRTVHGQVSFEMPTCLINAIAYGGVITVKNGTTRASGLPYSGAAVLVRTIDDATTLSCPLGEDAGGRFLLTTGSSASPVVFTNNAGNSANVFTTLTGVDDVAPARVALRVYPNPMFSQATIEAGGAPLGYVALYDIRGRLIRQWGSPLARGGPSRVVWNGLDERGSAMASGIYFIRTGIEPERRTPVVLVR